MSSLKIGVINWDGCPNSDTTYFGTYSAKSLSNPKYADRVPFYADRAKDGTISFHDRTQEEFDTELTYAAEAGIDYFAYVWYTERSVFTENEPVSETARHVHELTRIRRLHKNSPKNTTVKMCALLSAHPITDEELDDLALTMQESYYQDMDGRPLVYLFSGYHKELILRLQEACRRAGTPLPYIVPCSENQPARPGETYDLADGISAYCIPTDEEDCPTAEDFIRATIEKNSLMLTYPLDMIPMYSAGWNPSPRVDSPVPWYQYSEKQYAPASQADQLEPRAKALAQWLQEKSVKPRHILTFAWNEFEEGGFLCPTRFADGSVNSSNVVAFRRVVDFWKSIF